MDKIPLVGGPRDGELVSYCGPVYLEPVPTVSKRAFVADDQTLPPVGKTYNVRRYDLHQWYDGHRTSPRYVLHEQAKGLGVP